jgi:hypothetical protein
MSGVSRIAVGKVTQSKTKGKKLVSALANAMCPSCKKKNK